ncbi:AMP-binding protein [Luteipulveratus flavus]|uniref:Class I adenylate-forming enzyme family protein n=1 Tax=Luteipulveratus flavus TaxID=3031728 RepID=A0ABT6C2B0_9MICO|nr:class I adenylate-forming enzyme family protein [Luteipulveratus sp. YIM 133296]MDF8262942.1 class I adenylate-forming enzyme family protein [Luteipulveratus sp. YIM 133296]
MSLPAGAGNRVITARYDGTWAGLADAPVLPPAAAVLVQDNTEAVRAVWQAATTPRETLIAAATRVGDEQAQELRESGLAVVRSDAVEPPLTGREPEAGRVWLLTSGSTGRPKQVAHTLESLTTVGGDQPRRTWLCPYATGAYAWWQIVTLSLALPGQDVLFVEPSELDRWPQMAVDAGVTAASGTPTFWRQALFRSGDVLAGLQLEQITLGGEPVDQAILDTLREVFPKARISWIYASSEAGAAIAVHDGRAGFPAAWLERDTPGRPRLTVQDGELVIASAKAAEGMDAAIRTGDRAEVVGDRVLITGRIASDEINVGGSKASASKVRGVLLDHPDVRWAAVRGRKAPLVGQVVMAEVVLADGSAVTDADLTAWCAARLPDYSVPRRLRVLPEIPIKETLKSDV